jgi:hypothetical protein
VAHGKGSASEPDTRLRARQDTLPSIQLLEYRQTPNPQIAGPPQPRPDAEFFNRIGPIAEIQAELYLTISK